MVNITLLPFYPRGNYTYTYWTEGRLGPTEQVWMHFKNSLLGKWKAYETIELWVGICKEGNNILWWIRTFYICKRHVNGSRQWKRQTKDANTEKRIYRAPIILIIKAKFSLSVICVRSPCDLQSAKRKTHTNLDFRNKTLGYGFHFQHRNSWTFQSKALRMIVDAPWCVPNTVIRWDLLNTRTVKVEFRRYSSQCSVRLSAHPKLPSR
jgi:hypothetical protein